MYIRNVTAYKLDEMPDGRDLDEALGNSWFTPPGGLDWFNEGFSLPSSFADMPTSKAAGTLKICLMREEKVLPSAVIKKIVDDKVAEITAGGVINVGRKEKQQIKEEVIDDLLPRALTRIRRTFAVFANDWLLVDTAASKQAENLLTKLREAMGGLKGKPCHTRRTPASLMTEWLVNGKADGNFALGDSVTLQGSGHAGAQVKISKKDLSDSDVVQHARNGLTVKEIELIWKERIVFVLTDQFTLKRIRYLDVLVQSTEEGCDNAWDAEYAAQIVSAGCIVEILDELTDLCDGLID